LALALAGLPAGVASAQTEPVPPTPTPPPVVTENPCQFALAWHLRCPDLKMKRPFGLRVQYSRGRRLLRAGNSIDNVGRGPAELRGRRVNRLFMRARQRIAKTGREAVYARTGARLRYWKFYRAARFELWRLSRSGRRRYRVRRGAKIAYCLRDLRRTHGRLRRSPRHRVYPACNTNPRKRRVRLGTSVGWSDIYPPSYVKQWINVSGLRGCFALVHVADPGNGIFESNENNNEAQIVVRLPFLPGRQRCRGRSTGEVNRESGPY